MKFTNLILSLTICLFLGGCVSYSSLLNYNETPGIPTEPQLINNFKPVTVQPNDILQIQISGIDQVALAPFGGGATGETSGQGGGSLAGYLVNSKGEIDFPTLGKIKVEGLQMEEVNSKVQELIKPYFAQTPMVQVRLMNFRVNVNGEVGNPGTFTVYNDRVTIIEALTLAGDFTSYSRRDSILIVREIDGMRTFGYIDFNSSEVFNSPYYYLQQNDVVYVRPSKYKVSTIRDPANRFLPWVTAIVSVAALVISVSR